MKQNRLNQGLDTFTAFLDRRKAFDSIQRDQLLYRPKMLGQESVKWKMFE